MKRRRNRIKVAKTKASVRMNEINENMRIINTFKAANYLIMITLKNLRLISQIIIFHS